MSKQEERMRAWADLAGVPISGYNQNFMIFATARGYAPGGSFDDKMRAYLQDAACSTATNVNDLMSQAATYLGHSDWEEVGYDIINLVGCGGVTPPTVDAGGPYSVTLGDFASLDGTVVPGTDPAPATLWTIVSGGAGIFGNPFAVDTTFAPDNTGAYVLRLTADPNDGGPVLDNANLTCSPPFVAPTVDAGGPYIQATGVPRQLSGTVVAGSDPTPVLTWSIVSGGTGTFSDPSIEDPTFTATTSGDFILRLTADPNDGPPVFDNANFQAL